MTTVDRMKPAVGSWTEQYPELGTGLISYNDCTSSEFHELERRAVFQRVWLMVGRVEQLPRNGSYFTKELAVANTSIIVVRDLAGDVRAFHNVCRHRGNKLVWQDFPREPTAGNCRQFTCKYHGWQYGLDGACTFVQQEDEFFDLDKADFGLVPVHCDVWEGFVFVHLGEPHQPLREFLGPMLQSVEGYPFHVHTERYGYRVEVGSNWKLFFDAFQEYYHAPVLHANQTPAISTEMQTAGFAGAYYELDGPHRLGATGGQRVTRGMSPDLLKPTERLTRSGLIGPWDGPDFSDTAAGLNRGGFEKWTVSAFHVFPNTTILFRGAGWYLTYSYWPTAFNRHVFEGNLYFTPSRNARERVAHEMTRATHKEYALQDCNTLEATQMALESGVLTAFPLNDHEVLCRHLHQVVGEWVADYQREHAVVDG